MTVVMMLPRFPPSCLYNAGYRRVVEAATPDAGSCQVRDTLERRRDLVPVAAMGVERHLDDHALGVAVSSAYHERGGCRLRIERRREILAHGLRSHDLFQG